MTHAIESLPILVLEPHSRCNCRCVMCDIWKLTEAREISPAELDRHLADIVSLQVRWVVFTGGEPLMHSDLFRLADALRAHRIRITVLSTGLLLARHAAQIRRSIDDVIVSLDGPPEVHDEIRRVPGAFQRLAEGVAALDGVPVTARCTVQAANAAHLRATVHAARNLGLRSISFLAADLASTAFNRELVWPVERQASIAPALSTLHSEIEALIAAGDPFILESPAKLRRIVDHFRAHQGLQPHVAPRCNAPWVSAVVQADGGVRPCFFQPPLGNLAGRGLREILNSPQARAFRESLDIATNATCQRCVCSLYA